MSDETLLSAARRVVRFFNIDMNHGGLVSVETQGAIDTLDKMVRQVEAATIAAPPAAETDRSNGR